MACITVDDSRCIANVLHCVFFFCFWRIISPVNLHFTLFSMGGGGVKSKKMLKLSTILNVLCAARDLLERGVKTEIWNIGGGGSCTSRRVPSLICVRCRQRSIRKRAGAQTNCCRIEQHLSMAPSHSVTVRGDECSFSGVPEQMSTDWP